ncbi:hypothetical protein L0F51_00435 [Afifella sp. H1R]|uniref:hypothetical protein n=1 Tax=Afifella sp. H1R TaxID=2908841 RepID=UPI001F2739D1|nr:hypothetical protein [Afifella sp. H1R]MCF1502228.1 hypothetical protein [Afifella sp. H1R]
MSEPANPLQGPRIAEVLASASWKHALFTTYTLSLSYFESEILRPLLRGGCSDIWLVADVVGYRASLLERHSARIGQDYRLIPAALPDGVFHAKCIYLCGESEDVLLVGSGNVTFSGHGRNLEAFEAFSSAESPWLFEEFALFLESLGSRPDIQFACSEWVDDFAEHARRVARRDGGTTKPPISLVHSLDEPVSSQLFDVLAPYGSCMRATLMSPYHDADGEGAKSIIASLSPAEVDIAVTSRNDESAFPFAKAATWGIPVQPVRLEHRDTRFVHAKWYEFLFEDACLLLTGSINATRKALTTTGNVELGVLRVLKAGEGFLAWEQVGRPEYAPQARMRSGLGNTELVYASFDSTAQDRLRGQIVSLQPLSGTWQGCLVHADGDTLTFSAVVNAEGQFEVRERELEAFATLPSMQIVMSLADRTARGWVHNDMLLGMGTRGRLSAGALSRLVRRVGTDDDLQALLDYLSQQAETHLRLFEGAIGDKDGERSGERGEKRTVIVAIEELAPLEAVPSCTGEHGHSGDATGDSFQSIMAQLRRVLLGHGRSCNPAAMNGLDEKASEVPEDSPEKGLTAEETARHIGLVDFEVEMDRMIEDAEGRPQMRNGLLSMLLEVSMSMRLYRLNDRDGAHEFLSNWLGEASHFGTLDRETRSSLPQHVVTAAAILYLLGGTGGARAVLVTSLHDALETFYGGTVDWDHARSVLIADPQAGFATPLVGELEAHELRRALDRISATPTRRKQLDDMLARIARGEDVPSDWPIFQSPLGQKLWKALERPDPEKRVRRAAFQGSACAFDYYTFAPQEMAQFKRQRIGYCIHCHRFTVNTAI